MSINNRKEPFRYTLKEPIHFEIYILSINGVNAPPKPIQAELCDISRSGCQLSFPLSLPVENNDIRIGMNMLLFEDPLYMEGTLRWGQEKNTSWHYGVQLEMQDGNQDRLSREMRMLAGQGKIIVK
ncbi:PilZ domain-containing protein [Paenibacillus sp. PAMC 26794]|uniref:PilZ domain-containing protein n=1 Tax=Paenibacillus sp. PAMC 26794 TaxID=1257080 RepID=UPI00030DBD37|nr:PilZ domain-containing protein [Paenibacillus sp. PAMC 26794]